MALKKCSLAQKENVQNEAQHQLLLTFNDFSLECFAKGFVDDAIQLLNRAIAGEKNEKGLYLNRAGNYNFTWILQNHNLFNGRHHHKKSTWPPM